MFYVQTVDPRNTTQAPDVVMVNNERIRYYRRRVAKVDAGKPDPAPMPLVAAYMVMRAAIRTARKELFDRRKPA